MQKAENSIETWITNGTLPQQGNLEQLINIRGSQVSKELSRMRLPTSSVVVAWLQTSISSWVGRGRATLSPFIYKASAVFSTLSGMDEMVY